MKRLIVAAAAVTVLALLVPEIPGQSSGPSVLSFLNITGTLPVNPPLPAAGGYFSITSPMSCNLASPQALWVELLPGFTGPVQTTAIVALNSVAGTATATTNQANHGVSAISYGKTTVGTNTGLSGRAQNANYNIGVLGGVSGACGTAGVGVMGLSQSGAAQVGGYFAITGSNVAPATYNLTSSALLVDNGSAAAPVALFRANGQPVVRIDCTGKLQVMVGGTWKNVAVQP